MAYPAELDYMDGRIPRPIMSQMPQLLRRRYIAARRPWEVPTYQWSLLHPADTRSTGRYFQVVDKILPGPKLDALTLKGFLAR